MMMENGVLSIQGTGASIVSISSSESFKLLLQSCHSSVKPPFATQQKKKVTAPHIPLAIHVCVSTRISPLQTITCNHLDAHLWPRTQSTKTASYILVRFPNSEDPSSAVGLFLSTAYTFAPFIRCFSVPLTRLGTDYHVFQLPPCPFLRCKFASSSKVSVFRIKWGWVPAMAPLFSRCKRFIPGLFDLFSGPFETNDFLTVNFF